MAPPFVHHLALRARDVERTAAFYRDVIGLPERARHLFEGGALRSIWLDAGPSVLMVEPAAPGEPSPPPGSLELIAFAMSPGERDAFRGRFASAGVSVEAETANTLYVRDPEGRRVGVSSYDFGPPPGAAPPAPLARRAPSLRAGRSRSRRRRRSGRESGR